MKSLTIFIFCVSLIALSSSCNKTVKNESPNRPDHYEVPSFDTIYTGGGNEPGWRVLLLQESTGKLQFDLLLDYGESHLIGDVDSLPSPGPNMAAHFVLRNASKPLILSITNDACVDDGDQQYETSVTLSDQKFVLKGCGRFITTK